MTIYPKYCLAIVASIFAIHASAQKTTLCKETNGKLFYSYNKINDSNTNTFDVCIVYKNEQIIYNEEVDSVLLHNQSELNEFINGLQKVIESIADDKTTAYFEKPTYSILKSQKAMGGNFVSISNHSGSIISNNTKYQALELLGWIKSIDFGK